LQDKVVANPYYTLALAVASYNELHSHSVVLVLKVELTGQVYAHIIGVFYT